MVSMGKRVEVEQSKNKTSTSVLKNIWTRN